MIYQKNGIWPSTKQCLFSVKITGSLNNFHSIHNIKIFESLGFCTRPDILVARVELAKFLKHCPCCKVFICDFGPIQIVLRYRMLRCYDKLIKLLHHIWIGLISKQNATKYPVASHLLYKIENTVLRTNCATSTLQFPFTLL